MLKLLCLFLIFNCTACQCAKKGGATNAQEQSALSEESKEGKQDEEDRKEQDEVESKEPEKGKERLSGVNNLEEQPDWLQEKIAKFESEPKSNPPRRVVEYKFRGEKHYYISVPCCDQFSELYNAIGELVCHPDGGFTGKGDGKCPNFRTDAQKVGLIWSDPRAKKQDKEQLEEID